MMPSPPKTSTNHPKLRLRSSISSSPHFASASYGIAKHKAVPVASDGYSHLGAFRSNNVSEPPEVPLFEENSTVGTRTLAAGKVYRQPSALAFCPSQYNIYACINCVGVGDQVPTDTSDKRVGPILLDLRRLDIINDLESRRQGHVFSSSSISLSRGNPALGTSVSSTCLSFRPHPNVDPRILLPCATGLSTGALCVHSFAEDPNGHIVSSQDYFSTRHQRPSTVVAWRPKDTRYVAIGLDSSGGIRRAAATRPSGGSGDFCCLIWDVEAQPSSKGTVVTPMSKHSHNTGVASMAWLSEGQTLAVGCQSRNMQLYDLRVSGNSAPPTSISAHSESVNGIEVDPLRPLMLATFSRSPGEPVKIWDLRRMDASVGEIKASPPSELAIDPVPFVSALQWSCTQVGTLSVVLSNIVQHYDTTTFGSRPVLTGSNMSSTPILDIAVNPLSFKHMVNQDESLDELAIDLYSDRMLTVVNDRSVCDIAKHCKAPLAISHRDGRLIHAFGRCTWNGTTAGGSQEEDCPSEDISAIMMRRARCLHESRYTVDAAANISMLSQANLHSFPGTIDSIRRQGLIQLWGWIARVEGLCGYDVDCVSPPNWPAKGLVDSGVWCLLNLESTGNIQDESVLVSRSLQCNTYDSPERRAALLSCGWSDRESESYSLPKVLNYCELAGEYERAAALAVWHDDLATAVEILQRGASTFRDNISPGGKIHDEDLQHAQSMQLVAMCIAGYPGAAAKTSDVWMTACQNLLERHDISWGNSTRFGAGYLRAACHFLLNVGTEKGHDAVMNDSSLRLSDRVAFACCFLERVELKTYLLRTIDESRAAGMLEGLVITGMDKKGFRILQAFVDQCSDIQTVALVTSRVMLPAGWTTETQMCAEWLDSYRGLLNAWQMWQSRAMFDVDRAELLRKIARKSVDDNGSGPRAVRLGPSLKRQVNPVAKANAADHLPLTSIPAQLDARCNYCSMSLSGARHQEISATQWLSNQKPVLSCCPSCRKPLPRCAICLLSLGCLNPYMKLKKEINLPFAEWFTWCMRCKHGGHAHHIVGWFAKHESCPVSGCSCRCQFDGIQKLAKPLAFVQLASENNHEN